MMMTHYTLQVVVIQYGEVRINNAFNPVIFIVKNPAFHGISDNLVVVGGIACCVAVRGPLLGVLGLGLVVVLFLLKFPAESLFLACDLFLVFVSCMAWFFDRRDRTFLCFDFDC